VAANAEKTRSLSNDAEQALLAMQAARERTLRLVAHIGDGDLERVHSPIMSPLAWDLGHIAAYEDLWLAHRHCGMPLLRPELADLYDAFETPRSVRGQIEALRPTEARNYLTEVRERAAEALTHRGLGDGLICEMVLRHELQHSETMRQAMAIAGLLPAGEPPLAPARDPEGWTEIPEGPFSMGAGDEGFAYDNERPRHSVEVGAFRVARRPVSNASWMRFSEGGGYVRREWWSEEGWAWKEEYDITHHPAVAAGDPQAPACHVSWFEADAFARAHDARLPSEAEWERAATWTREREDGPRPLPSRRREAPSADARTLADDLEAPADDLETPAGGRTLGALAGAGQVWEWTDSHFHGYPGFVAHPYREYSEVFFGEDYRVLRGGSWATSERLASTSFRNWDLPQRRQIFSGVRLARDAG
jgi:iron(II)-dependent oxidoreductase